MSLLDSFSSGANGVGNGLLGLLQAIPNAAMGPAASPPPIDPTLASMVSPDAQAVAAANYQRNMRANVANLAAGGAKPYQLGPAAGQAAGQAYNSDIMQSVKDAMLLRQMRVYNAAMPLVMNALGGGGGSVALPTNGGAAQNQGQPQPGAPDASAPPQPEAQPGAAPPGAVPQPRPAPGAGAPPGPMSGPLSAAPPGPMASKAAPMRSPQQYGVDPFMLLKGAAAMTLEPALADTGKQLMDAAKTMLQYDPQLATKMAAAKSDVSVDQQRFYAAQQANDQQGMFIWKNKLNEDAGIVHLASMSGTRTQMLPDGSILTVEPNNSTYTLQDPRGRIVQGNIQGAAGAIQQREAAKSLGEAAGKPGEVTDAQGNERVAGSEADVITAAQKGGGIITKIGPAQEQVLKGAGEQATETNKEYQEQAENATSLITSAEELKNAATRFGPGQLAPQRLSGLNALNSLGLATKDDLARLSAGQVSQKIAIQLQAQVTKQLGSREAAQIFEKMGKSMPNFQLSGQGLDQISGYLEGIAKYQQLRARVSQQRFNSQDVSGTNNVRNEFIANTNPGYFILGSMSPESQRTMLQGMGAKAPQFLAQWKKAAAAGWAPDRSGGWANGEQF